MSWGAVAFNVAMMAANFLASLLFRQNISQTDPIIGAIKITTSAYGLTRPVLYGINRLSGNMIWYGDYTAIPYTTKTSAGGKGGGPTYTQTSWTYTASFALGLCEGEIIKIVKGWAGDEELDLYPKESGDKPFVLTQTSNWTVKIGELKQEPWAYLVSKHPDEAIRYPNLSYAAVANYNLGSNPSLPNFSFVVEGKFVIYDNERDVNETYTFDTTITVINSEDWLSTNYVKYTGGAYLVEVTTSPNIGEYSVSAGVYTFNSGETGSVDINYKCKTTSGGAAANIIRDIITNKFYGLGLSDDIIDMDTYEYENYCLAEEFFLSPLFSSQTQTKDVVELLLRLTNTEVVYGDDKIIFVPLCDTTVTSEHASWSPDLTPICHITYEDMDDKDGLVIKRYTSRDAHNHVAINHINCYNEYNTETTEYQDQGDMIDNGKRSMGTITANGIITKELALKVGRILCKRSLQVRNKFLFTLPINFIFLQPMDIISITSEEHSIYEVLVRVINMKIGQNDIQMETEELGIGSGTAPLQEIDVLTGYKPNKLVDPGDANTPIIWVPPLGLANYEIWLATSGGVNWGGCHVWVSDDNDTYRRVGTMIGGSRYGVLTADLPESLVSPDTVNTLSVDLTESRGELTSGTQAEADALRTLCYVDGEYLAYKTATLTGSYQYDLEDYLVRGCFGTAMALHEIGSNFVRLDDAIFKYPITAAEVGRTIFVKLQSFNIHGHAVQDLADVTEHEYTIPPPGSEIDRAFTNLTIANNSVSPDTKIDISYDSCDHRSTAGNIYSVGGRGFTIDLETVGLNGLDSGSVAADTWYYLFSIANPTQGTVGGLASLSAASPTLPVSFTHKQIIGAVKTDGTGDLLEFSQIDYELLYGGSQLNNSDTSAENWSDQNLSDQVPPIATRAMLSVHIVADADDVDVAVRRNGSSSSGQILGTVTAGNAGQVSGWVDTDLGQVVELFIDPAPVSWALRLQGFRFNV